MASSGASATTLKEFAPAKVNLTLRVLGRRADGYHELESWVAFAEIGDRLSLRPGDKLALTLSGPMAAAAGPPGDNLVLKAAKALRDRIGGLTLGHFRLTKRLPAAAGIGGGSADAAAALRLLARANNLSADDPQIMTAAATTGADVPVCLDPRPRIMRGIGDILDAPLTLPRLAAVLVNPGVAVATRDVFAAWHTISALSRKSGNPEPGAGSPLAPGRAEVVRELIVASNDLEAPAIALQPIIADVLAALRADPACRLARMSGSGATCFGLFDSRRSARAAALKLRVARPDWWVQPTMLGAAPTR